MSKSKVFSYSLAILICLISYGCSQNSEEPALLEKVQNMVRERLKDPDSAKFRSLLKYGTHWVCGQVNAKNGMGGYVGYSSFDYEIEKGELKMYQAGQESLCESAERNSQKN